MGIGERPEMLARGLVLSQIAWQNGQEVMSYGRLGFIQRSREVGSAMSNAPLEMGYAIQTCARNGKSQLGH
uniref:Uncharacterized protein n=1 Tax=Pristionchus pacificus TaxID=54126 RepID=A0A2A6CYD0_PRIPA|eukprot:PDM83096.1 hypothetical protein PRIPAC_37489 [Pristionchus pacificus]